MNFRRGWGLIGAINAGEIFQLASAGFLIQAFHIALFADFKRCMYMDFDKIFLADDIHGHVPDIAGGADEAVDGDDTALY